VQLLLTDTMASDVRFRCDWSATSSLSDATLYRLLQQSIAELSEWVQSALSEQLTWMSSASVTVSANTGYGTLPDSNILSIVSVTWSKSADEKVPLSPADKGRVSQTQAESWNDVRPEYLIDAQKIYVYPTPTAQQTLTVQYTSTQWISTTPSALNGFYGNPAWAEWVVLDTSKKIAERDKRWEDVQGLVASRNDAERRIRETASRDRAQIYEIRDESQPAYDRRYYRVT